MSGIRAAGPSGTLRVGYQWAADLGPWTLEPASVRPAAFVLRSRLVASHSYWIDQGPLDLALALGQTEWLWRGVEVLRDGNLVSVVLAERPIVAERVAMERA